MIKDVQYYLGLKARLEELSHRAEAGDIMEKIQALKDMKPIIQELVTAGNELGIELPPEVDVVTKMLSLI